MKRSSLRKLLSSALAISTLGMMQVFAADAPVTFTFFSKDVNNNYDDWKSPVAQKITEATGVTIKAEYPTGDLAQKIGLMIAASDYPDMIFVATQEQGKLVEAGALLPLDKLIDQYGPHLKALYGKDIKRLRYTKDDPQTYYVGCFGVNAERWRPNMGFELQHQAVIDAGYPKMSTLADAEKVIAAYVKKHPTTADGKPTIGLSLIYEDWRWMCGVGNMGAFTTGKPDDGQWYVNPKTNEATYRFYLSDHKDYYKWLNHMWDIGLLDKESFTQKYDQYSAKISSGRVVALNDQQWQFDAPNNALRATMPNMMYGFYPIQAKASYKCADFQDFGYSAGWGVSITKSCKDPVRAIKWLDWMASDEAQILTHWGIEGKDYVLQNGKRVITPEQWKNRLDNKDYGKESGVGAWSYPFPERGDGQKDSSGQFYTINTPEQVAANYTEVEKSLLAKYGVKMWKDLYPKASDLPRSTWGQAWQIPIASDSDISLTIKKCDDIVRASIPKMVMGSPADFDKNYNEMIAKLKAAGVEKANADFTKLIKARVELWTK
jgi:ABC-type sugar transport system, periplasmic component